MHRYDLDDTTRKYIDLRVSIQNRIKNILIDKLKVDRTPHEIDPDTPLFGTGLSLDSIDAVELWISVGEEFRFFPPEDERRVTAMRTINTLVDMVLEMTDGGTNESA